MKLNPKQAEAQILLAGNSTHGMLFGGSRSGKTFLHVRNTIMRAVKAPKSRHVMLRLSFKSIKNSIVLDTFPKVMDICFPGVAYNISKTDWYATFANGSEIWFAGLDDKERIEKILGMEFVTVYLNECSQIPWSSVGIVMTRLAQKAYQVVEGVQKLLKPRAYYDCNPPNKAHWSYRLFIEKRDPDTKQGLPNPENYVAFQINPDANTDNLSPEYLDSLKSLSARLQKRFLKGEFTDANPSQLFSEENIEANRVLDGSNLPDMVRVVVSVDPSGADDEASADNDAIGVIVAGLGTDGCAYLLEDCTVKAGPATWGKVATSAFDRHQADTVVGESNYGGAMVKHVIMTARPRTPYKQVTASRGKHVRAEPFSALYEQGKVRHVGNFPELEDELVAFTTFGYVGEDSPNRADALIWALAELFPGMVKAKKEPVQPKTRLRPRVGGQSWMGS
ncbi:phage terminase large subunit [Pseudomonas sp. MONT-RG-20F-20-E-7-02]|uniref:phage terminase large subunit n=1 Tax=Pseudomonas sp. MONT-RG-20F-20-E-7-02 TaxID=2914979 RepID=UPI001F57E003|nr:phage terminase large subunit [Pseudomonas sp. MONT-RG-20F-20-E-7-02]